MSLIYISSLEFLAILQPYAEVVAFLDKSSVFSTLTAAAITASLLYIVFYVPRLSVTFKQNKVDNKVESIDLIIKNRKLFVTFNSEDGYMHFWIPKSLFQSTAMFGIKPHSTNPKLEITEYPAKDGSEYYRLVSIQPFPLFPKTETAVIVISGDFNLTPNIEHTVYYYFSTKHGYYPKNALKRLNPLSLPTASISFE